MTDPNQNRPGFKPTKAGWIPVEWECARVGDAGEILGGRQRSPRATGLSRKYLRVANVLGGTIDTSDVFEMPFEEGEFERYRLAAGDILLNEGQSLELVGRSAVYEGDPIECAFQNTLIRFRAHPGVSVPFAHNVFTYLLQRGVFAAIASKTTSIAHLGVNRFSSLHIAIPPQAEQNAIAAILTTCDDAIEGTRALIAAKQRQKLGLMQQLLTGQRRLPGFAGNWLEYRLAALLAQVVRPIQWSPDKILNLVSVRRRSGGLFRRPEVRCDSYKTIDLHELRSGDFLVSKRQVTHGALAMVTDEFDGCHVSKEYSIFTVADPRRLHMPFFDWLSRTRRMWWHAFVVSNGVVIEKLIFDPGDFLKVKVRVPPTVKEQSAIAVVLKTVGEELATLELKLNALQLQKRGLMQKLLTGLVRVNI